MIIVLSGPGGAGKGTVAKSLSERNQDIHLSRSVTSRPRRKDEDPNAYQFISDDEFKKAIEANELLEWIKFCGHYYGTPYSELNPLKASDSEVMLLEIDVQGAQKTREVYPEAVLIFLDAPSDEIRLERLKARGDSSEHAEERMRIAAKERENAKSLDAIWIINDDLNRAAKEIEGIIAKNRR